VSLYEVATLALGSGVFAVLLRMSGQLGGLTVKVKDHESRIVKLERWQ
jgi:hypothetical protein